MASTKLGMHLTATLAPELFKIRLPPLISATLFCLVLKEPHYKRVSQLRSKETNPGKHEKRRQDVLLIYDLCLEMTREDFSQAFLKLR